MALSDDQFIKEYMRHGTKKLAEILGQNPRTVSRKRQRIESQRGIILIGPDPRQQVRDGYPAPDGHIVKGWSELVRADDDDPLNRIVYWVKTNKKLTDQLDECRVAAEAMAVDLPKMAPVKYRGNVKNKNQFSVIPIGDPHIGLRTWAKEVGVDWDVPIALRVYEKVFRRLFERTPDTKECIVFNSGDFFHADNMRGETERSGHKLDLDGRPGYWMDAGMGLMKLLLVMALQKYEKVHFVNAPGNHDDILGLALGVFVKHVFENEPRMTCQLGNNAFQYVERGKVALGFAHGHTCKLNALPGKMADDQHDMWGRTTHRHWITGHVHHNQWLQFKEHPGCTVESVGIIPPKDAYSYGGGYGARRGTQLLIFDESGYTPDRYTEVVRADD